jgi:SAM-dependent methyltransferase
VRQDETTKILSSAFGGVAGEYDRLRPGPPAEALDWLLPPGAAAVLEIGAGTGILTRRLAERVPHVIAVEPDDRMRALLPLAPGVDVLAGWAETLPALDGSVDAVVAASAWHWVDEERAVPEVARVLRPHGRLALVWSGPDRSVDWMRSLWAGGMELSPDEKVAIDARRRQRHMVNVELGGHSPFEAPASALFKWTQPMSRRDLVALATTYSSVITMDTDNRDAHLTAMTRYLDGLGGFAGQDVLDVPMRSYCWRATKHA